MKEVKDSYYFPHDANTRNDPKIMALLSKYGVLGYGRFWIVLEMLRDQKDYQLRRHGWIVSALALAMQCSEEEAEEFVEDCIVKFELFICDGEVFWSESLIRRMEIKDDKKKKRAEAGQRGAVARWGEKVEKEEENSTTITLPCDGDSNTMRLPCDTNAKNSKEEESKVKEKKVEEKSGSEDAREEIPPEPKARLPDDLPVGVERTEQGAYRLIPQGHDAEGKGVLSSDAVLFVAKRVYDLPDAYDLPLRAWIETHGNELPKQHDTRAMLRLVDQSGADVVTKMIRKLGDKGYRSFDRLRKAVQTGVMQ